ncbi:MAG: ATP-binding protein [Phycisphaerae bacterium]|nr:ATP-binding protein [Phycisphaerae bacterium]
MIPKPLADIQVADLRSLITDGVEERRTLEFKRQLPTNSGKDKHDLCADVSSLANTGGGHLIFGMRAERGVAKELVGLDTDDADGEILRLESIVRSGVDPRREVFRFRSIHCRSRLGSSPRSAYPIEPPGHSQGIEADV